MGRWAFIILLASMSPYATVCLEKFMGVTRTLCYPDEIEVQNPSAYVFARVNATFTEEYELDRENIYCQMLDENGNQIGTIALEAVLFGDLPQALFLHVADVFTSDLRGTTISCNFQDIALHKDETSNGSRQFICDMDKLHVTFTGISGTEATVSPSDTSHRREIRSADDNSLYSEIECSDGSSPLNLQERMSSSKVGQVCSIPNDEYSTKIGRLWLISSNGQLDCLPCCKDHYWDGINKECERCSPGTMQPLPNFWKHCEPEDRYRQHPVTEGTPESVTTFPLLTTTPTVTSSPEQPSTENEVNDSEQSSEEDSQGSDFGRPLIAPTNLTIAELGVHHLKVRWNNVTQTKTEPVTKYMIEVTTEGPRKKVKVSIETKCEATIFKLDPETTYYVTVLAGNEMGYGPPSTRLPVTTIPELQAPQSVHPSLSYNLVTILWKLRSWEGDLNVEVLYWVDGGPKHRYNQAGSIGKIRISLSEHGHYYFEMYYTSGETKGPKTDFRIRYTTDDDFSILHWIRIAIAVIVVSIAVIAIIWCLVTFVSGT